MYVHGIYILCDLEYTSKSLRDIIFFFHTFLYKQKLPSLCDLKETPE